MTVIRINRRRPVLLVSRDVDTQDMYVFALRAERIPAVSVSAFQDAVALARQTDISVVLFDVERPADWDAVSELRRELPADVPIVVLTGWVRTDGANRALAKELGCSGFLAKPVPPPVMITFCNGPRPAARGPNTLATFDQRAARRLVDSVGISAQPHFPRPKPSSSGSSRMPAAGRPVLCAADGPIRECA